MYSAKKTVAVLPVLFSKHSVGAHLAYIWTLPAARYFLPVQPSGYYSGVASVSTTSVCSAPLVEYVASVAPF